jgi:hypothetical protein
MSIIALVNNVIIIFLWIGALKYQVAAEMCWEVFLFRLMTTATRLMNN